MSKVFSFMGNQSFLEGGKIPCPGRRIGSDIIINSLVAASPPAAFPEGNDGRVCRIHGEVIGFPGYLPVIPQTYFRTQQAAVRSEEHTSELQSLMRNAYAHF